MICAGCHRGSVLALDWDTGILSFSVFSIVDGSRVSLSEHSFVPNAVVEASG